MKTALKYTAEKAVNGIRCVDASIIWPFSISTGLCNQDEYFSAFSK